MYSKSDTSIVMLNISLIPARHFFLNPSRHSNTEWTSAAGAGAGSSIRAGADVASVVGTDLSQLRQKLPRQLLVCDW